MSLPNRIDIIERVNAEHPGLIVRDPHAFTALACTALHAEDTRFGLNGKRGNPHDTSEDCTAYLDDESPLVGSDGRRIWIVDFIAFANSKDARPAWIDQTRATMANGTTGVWVQPKRVSLPSPDPAPSPPPAPSPTPACRDYSGELGTIKAQLASIVDVLQALVSGHAHLGAEVSSVRADLHHLVGNEVLPHLDDVKRIIAGLPREERFR